MRLTLSLLIACLLQQPLIAQRVYTIKADSVKITSCDSAELIIENHTQNIPGFLFNRGNGRTIFKRALEKINDSAYLVGPDTLKAPWNIDNITIVNAGSNTIATKEFVVMRYPDLRNLTRIDTSLIYRTVINKMIGDFYYDPADATTADDSAMTIVTVTGKRLKRYTQGVLYPRWFGASADGITDDSYAIQKMFNYITQTNATQYWKVYFEGLTYNIGSGITLPMMLSGGSASSPHIDIDGGGAVIKTSAPAAMFRRVPGNDAMAQPMVSNWIGEIHNFEFRGTQTSGQVGLDLGACYSWNIHNNHFASLDTAIKARFFLQNFIRHNRFTNNKSICIWMKWGDWPGGTMAGDANNANIIEGNRFFNWDSAYAAVYMLAGNKNTIRNNISEGNKPVYEFFYDYSGSTNVVSTEIHDWYSETVPGKVAVNTLFSIRMSGTFDIDNVSSIYPCVLLNLDNSGPGSILNVNNFNYYLVADTPFSARQASIYGLNIGKTGLGLFTLMNAPNHWTGNVLPTFSIMYVGANQQGSTIYSAGAGTAQINNRLAVGGNVEASGYLIAHSTLYTEGYTYHNNNVFMNGAGLVFQVPNIIVGSIGERLTDSSLYIASKHGGFAKQGKTGNWTINTQNIDAPTPVALSVIGADAVKLPLGTTAQRPTGDSAYYRFNTDSSTNELHDGGSWQAVATRNWVRANTANTAVIRKYTASFAPGTAGSTLLFTTDAGSGFFIITGIAVVTTASPGPGATSFTFSVGTNASSYDNIVSSQATSVTTVNGVTMVRPANFVVVPASGNCYLNVASPSGPGGAVQVFVTGYYQNS